MQESIEVRKSTLERYDWGRSIKVWENYIDSYQSKNLQGRWDSPPQIHNIPTAIPPNLSHKQFVHWVFNDVIGQPKHIYTEQGMSMYRDLVYGARVSAGNMEPINRDKIFEQFKARAHNKNAAEAVRAGHQAIQPQQFLIDAHQRHKRVMAK